jgi:hypothetical protein
MSRSLVCDLPDTVDPVQVVKIDPPVRLVLEVKAELDGCGIPRLSNRDEPAHHAPTGRGSPVLKALGDQILMKDALGVDVENPGAFIEGFFEFPDIVVVESIDVELNNANDLVIVIGSCSHADLLPFVHAPIISNRHSSDNP